MPAALVAHVQTLDEATNQSIEPGDDAPAWLAGNIHWRGHTLPLIAPDYPTLETSTPPIAILHTLNQQSGPEFFACLLSALPTFLQLPARKISWTKEQKQPLPCVLGAVKLDDGIAWIPDLESLEASFQSGI